MKPYYSLDTPHASVINLEWKGTIGVGDFMWGLNVAHSVSHVYKRPVNIAFHWYHEEDYLHHYEDPETIIERLEYVKTYYLSEESVNVFHMFNSTDDQLFSRRYRNISFNPTAENRVNYWQFRPDCFLPTDENKVVIWRPLFNAASPHSWKEIVTPDQWNKILDKLSTKYDVIELSYRSPISEAMYHIATCNFVVCYDGMWHYIARNFFKPMCVFSTNRVTRFHTPNAVMVDHRNAVSYIDNIQSNIDIMQLQADRYKTQMEELYNAY